LAAISTTNVGTSAAAATPAIAWAAFIVPASVLVAIKAIATPCATTPAWKTRRSPASLPTFAPSMTNAATTSE
jgi:hypothetical protein